MNTEQMERLWRRERLNALQTQPKKPRLWRRDGRRLRMWPAHWDHVWSYKSVHQRTDDGREFRIQNILDERPHECLLIRVRRELSSRDVLKAVSAMFLLRGVPHFIRSDNGPDVISKALDLWAWLNGVTLDFSRPGKPTYNAFIESFNGSFRAECLNACWFLSLADAQAKCDAWLTDYNTVRLHSSIGQKTPIELAKSSRPACRP